MESPGYIEEYCGDVGLLCCGIPSAEPASGPFMPSDVEWDRSKPRPAIERVPLGPLVGEFMIDSNCDETDRDVGRIFFTIASKRSSRLRGPVADFSSQSPELLLLSRFSEPAEAFSMWRRRRFCRCNEVLKWFLIMLSLQIVGKLS